MCGRFYLVLDENDTEMRAILERMEGSDFTQGEIFPSQMAPVLVSDGQGGYVPRMMQWGFPHWEKKSPVINARQETVSQSPFFKPAFVSGRCLVPANWFFEWQHTEQGKRTKDKMAISLAKGRLMFMAGIYKKLEDGHEVFTILTRAADKQVRPIHDRMPVMLTTEAERSAYLSGPAEAFMLLANIKDAPLVIEPVIKPDTK
jgi:putative SOS response-associated peptidase YedK